MYCSTVTGSELVAITVIDFEQHYLSCSKLESTSVKVNSVATVAVTAEAIDVTLVILGPIDPS